MICHPSCINQSHHSLSQTSGRTGARVIPSPVHTHLTVGEKYPQAYIVVTQPKIIQSVLSSARRQKDYRHLLGSANRETLKDTARTHLSTDGVISFSDQTDKADLGETRSISHEKPAIMKPAAACDCYPRQHRYDLLGSACRLATAALLPTLAHGTLSLGYELDCFIQEPESRETQAQKLAQPIHRQFTSLYRRRCCWLAGLVPLTWHYYTSLCLQCQTFVRMFDKCEPCTVLGKHGNQANCFGHAEEPFSTSRKAA